MTTPTPVETEPMESCPDCGVEPQKRHIEGCDVARCPFCGAQDLGHIEQDDPAQPPYCPSTGFNRPADQMQVWTGLWPGVAECREFGWFARWTTYVDFTGDGIVVSKVPTEAVKIPNSGQSFPCEADHPHAHEDLNRLALFGEAELRWDRTASRWVKR